MLMVALQNTQHVLIRATESLDVRRAEISDISWDIAEPTFGRPGAPALGIERCACPGRYNGSSCQDPSIGFYRIQRHEYQSSEIIIELVGEVVPCQCNGRATTCDPETGICLNCTGNTAGRRCDLCAPGYYGDPLAGACRRCLCPTEEVSHAFGCSAYYGSFRCQCKPGYAGERCDRCAYGYYGDARDPAAGCVPCGCDRTGSVSQRCDPVSGQCLCRAGLLGRTCSGCPARHALTDNGCQECSDTCVQLLFEEVDELTEEVTTVNVTRTVGAPWRRLFQLSNTTEQYEDDFSDYIQTQLTLKALYDSLDLTNFANTILIRTKDLMSTFPALTNNTRDLRDQIKAINESVEASRKEAEDIVAELLRYARGETPAVSVEQALADVRAILELMQKRNFSEAQERAEAELAAARRLLERVGGFGVNRTAHQVVSSRLEEMRRRLLDMQQLMEEQVRRPVRKANVLLEELMDGLDSLSAGRQQVQSEAEQCEGVLANTTELQTRLYRLYDQAQGHGIDLSDIQLELSLANASLQKRLTTLANLTDDFRVRYVIPAEVHADRLTTEAERLVGLFQATRQGANLSLNAAQAYQDIVDALAAARTAAEEASSAAQTAYRQAYPADTDSLVSLGTQTKTRSEELLKAAEVVKRQVVELSEKLAASRERLQRINGTLDKVAAVDQDVRLQLQTLDDIGVTEAARGVTEATRGVTEAARGAANRSQAALAASELVLSRQAGADGIGNASRTVDEARKSLTKADLRALDVEMKAADVEALSDGVGLKLQNLKNKILKARQAASNVSDEGGGASQGSYAPKSASR
ncbi:laminin subunit alpha-1-like [Pollicipes pollicipes]|uniref:laminin subunit alpha-1-like n=1 Tax=Pollicipes pollicipes TaxID=41117 RepID=UPI001884A118|nr:laminin subunit alpha-1-like [Pollicipes pollicipes]